ncbi:MAG: SLC13 family permease, partial [Candidatus Aminicenantes bacterium]|nr:SLC13 family permease [Candidatus Aminicenantes bacterium]
LIEVDIAIFSALILLIIGGVIDVKEAFSGFSNHGMLTVAFLFVVAGALQKTAAIDQFGHVVLGRGKKTSITLLRFLPGVASISAFFNNTPIVAILIPTIVGWAKKKNISPSKLLIPLSYAAILGGLCTLIGTSTNLVVHGLMLENGMKGFSFFEISKVGVPMAIFGIFLLSLFGHKLLPDRKEPIAELGEKTREFVSEMKVGSNFEKLGFSIEDAGLRHLKGLFLFQIERDKKLLTSVSPDENILLNDRLFFVGLPETIMDLRNIKGLTLLKDIVFDPSNYDSEEVSTFEVVISSNSPLVGKCVRESKFRTYYDAVIIAIHRSGDRIKEKIGDIVLRPGDTLMILANRDFIDLWYNKRDFFLVSRSADVESKPKIYSYLSLTVLTLMIVMMALQVVPVLLAVSTASIILIISGTISPYSARNSIDWKVILVIASAFGIAKGMLNSGVASFLADKIISVSGSLGPIGLIAVIYFITSFYTEIITNNAAAALIVPVAISVSSSAGIDPIPLLIAVAIAASASFATPIGYQTNLMVYGPGGYKFKDYLKIGIPMNLIMGVIAVLLIYFIYY